jgi:hypothetical protein
MTIPAIAEREAHPYAGPLKLLPYERIAKSVGPFFDMLSGPRSFAACSLVKGAAAPARREAVNQLIGLRYCEEPSSEKVMNSGAAAYVLQRTAPAEACVVRRRRGCRPNCRDCRPSGRRGRRHRQLAKSSVPGM